MQSHSQKWCSAVSSPLVVKNYAAVMQLLRVQWGAQRQPASMHSPHLSLEKFKVTGSMLRPYVSKAEFGTGCVVSRGLISSTVFEAVESTTLRTSFLLWITTMCQQLVENFEQNLPQKCMFNSLTAVRTYGTSFIFVYKLPALYVKESGMSKCCLCWAFGAVRCTEGTFLCEGSGISSITPGRPGTWTVHCL